MGQFSEMEWSTRWDWENIVSFGSRAPESPRKQLMEWMIDDKGGMFNLSMSSANNSGTSTCDGRHNSSAKSSISASADSSTKYDVRQMPNSGFRSGNWSKKIASRNYPPSSVGTGEQMIGLKLGKQTYFENSVNSTSFAELPTPSSGALNKNKTAYCQVQGCDTDLSDAKDYHKKHKVCEGHSKCPKVIVRGLESRFCQQCSRFHSLSEFDKKKRSCRKRLSDHNARRRKPQQQIIQFNSPRLSSTFNGGGFLLNNPPPVGPITPAKSVWDNTHSTKFTLTKGYRLKSGGDARSDERLHLLGINSPHVINVPNGASGLSASNNSTFQAFNPVSKGSSSLDSAAPHRALSLLSSEPEPTPFQSVMHENGSDIGQPMVHAVAEGVPPSPSEFWLRGQQSIHSNLQSLSMSNNFQQFQLFRAPYEANYDSNSSIY